MIEFQIGQIVKSKAGRDKDKLFVIMDIEDEYIYLVDGMHRRIQNPKKKKIRHVQPLNLILDSIKYKMEKNEKLTNSDIKNELMSYMGYEELS